MLHSAAASKSNDALHRSRTYHGGTVGGCGAVLGAGSGSGPVVRPGGVRPLHAAAGCHLAV